MAKYYYNGVLLPEIPADVLARYPYAWIRKNTTKSEYNLIVSRTGFITNAYNNMVNDKAGEKITAYVCPMVNGIAWTETTGYVGWPSNETSIVLWSNCDIASGSSTGSSVYFYATYPIPEADECYYNGVLLPAIPADVLLDYPYCVMYRNSAGTQFLLAGPNKWWSDASKNRLMTDNATTYVRYILSVDSAWIYDNSWTDNGLLPFANIDWSNQDIPNGSATSTTIYFHGNSPVAAEPETPPQRTRGYIIRSGSILYTVADGALSALTETEVTAEVFQTYGLDEAPDGVLLVGLTNPEVLYWQDSEDELPVLELTVRGTPPLPQVFTSEPMDLTHESIAGIDHAAVDASEDVRFAISFDDGASWQAFDGSAWFVVSDTEPGMLPSTMNAITAEQWARIVQLTACRLRFWLPNVTAYVKSVVIHYINP